MLFSVRITNYQNNLMLNICDAPLLGKKLVENKLKMHISESYYGERLVEKDEAENLLKKCSSINMVGKETISRPVSRGREKYPGEKQMSGAPFLIVFKM